MSQRFYVERSAEQGSIQIDGPEAAHISKVMRLKPGDSITLFDGLGNECLATLVSVAKKSVEVTTGLWQEVSREAPVKVSLFSAIPKGDRAKYMVEKLTEIGATRLVPVIFQRSNIKVNARTVEKFRRYVIEASKQCGRNQLMQIDDCVDLQKLAIESEDPSPGIKLVCSPTGGTNLSTLLSQTGKPAAAADNKIDLIVGPEGGLTDQELGSLGDSDWLAATLGPSILRTETAAIISCSLAIFGSLD